MFKWMISGHKNHKHRGKLNNALNNTNFSANNNNTLKSKPEEEAGEDADNMNNNFGEKVASKDWSQSHQNLSRDRLDDVEYSSLDPIPFTNGDDFKAGQRMRSVEHINSFSSFKPTVNGTIDRIPPPLPNPRVNGQTTRSHYLPSQEPLPQAPGTCILPRRALSRDDGGAKVRSPSNPAPNSRYPPPYACHQPPEPATSRARRPYQPPPPPRHQESLERLHVSKRGQEIDSNNFHPQSNGYQSWKDSDNWHNKDPDSGFESIPAQNDGNVRTQVEIPLINDGFNQSDNLPSKSSENLINASKVAEGTLNRKFNTQAIHPNRNEGNHSKKPDMYCSYDLQNTMNNSQILQSDSMYPLTESLPVQKPCQIPSNVMHNFSETNNRIATRLNAPPLRNIDAFIQSKPNLRPEAECSKNTACSSENRRDPGYNKPDSPYKYASTLKQYQSQYCDIEVKRKDSFHRQNGNEGVTEGWKSLYIKEPQDTSESFPSWQPRVQITTNQDENVDSLMKQNEGRPLKQNDSLRSLKQSEDLRPLQQRESSRSLKQYEGRSTDTLTVTDVRPSLRYIKKSEDFTTEEKSGSDCTRRHEKYEDKATDDCPSSSWSEWTNQLQAYVSWTNSQLRKKQGSELISDLRRDFLNGIVFGDIIEVIAGEKVSGINKNATNPQQCRDNLDRILQFMAAKKIRMTNITSKEIAEGNIKSIMRVILALASHYKPQSVRGSQQNSEQPNAPGKKVEFNTERATHDIGVGPDSPVSATDKKPSLTRNTLSGTSSLNQEEQESTLRRQPSLTNTVRSSSPVYENLPKRASCGRWAYDSLRASHKFQWNQKDACDLSDKKHLESDPLGVILNNSLSRCPSLNVSMDDEARNSADSSILSQSRPAALEFWKGLQHHEDGSKKSEESEESSPFRYHTVHRMSGRRKLPQIPGKASPCSNTSRVTTPQGDIGFANDEICKSMQSNSICGSINEDEASREPEGRSQNSSPATSLVRGSLIESWRGGGIDNWKDATLGTNLYQTSSHGTMDNNMKNVESTALKQEVIRHIIARQALETDKVDLSRNLQQRDNLILELRQQLNQKDKSLHMQQLQLDETIHQLQNGKINRPSSEFTSRGQAREELQLVRGAIGALRSNFRDTDPNQHTLDTLEQAIAVLMERAPSNSELGNKKERPVSNKVDSSHTKVIYFTERTVTPFMSTINKRIGDITLRDFKAIFDRPGFYRFHFKNHDPEYGLVKEEIINDDEILPGIDGKIIAWVEDEVE